MRIVMMIPMLALTAGLGAGAADAAPLGLQPAIAVGPAPQIELVRGGCGWGAHRGWYGHCRYNRGWRGHVRAARDHGY